MYTSIVILSICLHDCNARKFFAKSDKEGGWADCDGKSSLTLSLETLLTKIREN